MGQQFKVKDVGLSTHILGVEAKRDQRHGILTPSQGGYIKQVLDKYGMLNFNRTFHPKPKLYTR